MYTIYHISYHIYHDEGVAAPEVSMPVINRTGCASRLQSIPESQEEEKSEIMQKWHMAENFSIFLANVSFCQKCSRKLVKWALSTSPPPLPSSIRPLTNV